MVSVREARPDDHGCIGEINDAAFGCPDERRLVERLRADGDVVAELVAEVARSGHRPHPVQPALD